MKKVLLFLLVIALIAAIVLRVRYGGGEEYVNLTSTPLLDDGALEEVLTYPEPIGNVAVSADGRVFFTVHPEARPPGNKLLEYVDGASVPFPDGQSQSQYFDAPLGLVIDRFDRLWTIDHGNHGMRSPRLLAFDLSTNEAVYDQKLGELLAPSGSFLQDLQVSADGRTVVIADASFWSKTPALVVVDVENGSARRVLESDPSVSAEHYVIHNHGEPMTYGFGLVALRGGVDGISIVGDWLYFGALNGSGLFRIAMADLTDEDVPDQQLAARVERVTDKPLSDGLSADLAGNVYLTGIERGAIFRVDAEGTLETLIQSPRIRWADGLSFGPDGWLYVSDSALADVIMQSHDHIRAAGPYAIYRIPTGQDGVPGH